MYKFSFKRVLDVFLSLTAIVFLSPFLIPICLALLLTGEHDVFYLQKRIGYNNKEFKIIKFATMLKGSSKMPGGTYTTINDPRILPLGHFLRRTKINEIPQLFNVLIGNMSLIGPRPLVKKTYDFYSHEHKQLVSQAMPGMSGVQQIIFRNEDEILNKAQIPLDQYYKENIIPLKSKLEIWYIKNYSFSVDCIIILLTIVAVISRKNNLIYKIFKDLPKNKL